MADFVRHNMMPIREVKDSTVYLSQRLYDTQTWIKESISVRKIVNDEVLESFLSNVVNNKYAVKCIPPFVQKKNTTNALR
jgi:hypothetical protein